MSIEIRTRLACGIETKHEQAHFARAKDLAHHLRDLVAHDGEVGCRAQRADLEVFDIGIHSLRRAKQFGWSTLI